MSSRPQRMRFVGVTTAQSSIMRVFPAWADELGLDAELVGLDIELGASPEAYHRALDEIADDPACVGALVTTHKVAMFDAVGERFDTVDEFASAIGEVSSIAKRDGQVIGRARDPITSGLAIEEFIPADFFDRAVEVLCLGAGGAGAAIGWYLADRRPGPAKLTFTDVDRARLDHLGERLRHRNPDIEIELHLGSGSRTADRLLGTLSSAGGLIINATGLGKDRPGSPLDETIEFPDGTIVWELNYRGSLEFLGQARDQQESKRLTIVDGWRYFIHGWTQVIGDVFGIEMDHDKVERLAEIAERMR